LAQGLDFAVKQRPELAGSVSISDGVVRDPKVLKAHAPAAVAAAAHAAAPAAPSGRLRALAAFLAVSAVAALAAGLIVLFR
jgi:hypothetical protein